MEPENVFCRPSQVYMWKAALPFVGTFNRAETELAAAMIVATCAHLGDRWQAVDRRDVGAAMLEVIKNDEAWAALNRNPFCPVPDMQALVDGGWARWVDGSRERIVFTANGFGQLIEKGWMKEQT